MTSPSETPGMTTSNEHPAFFDREQAASYDERFASLAPIHDALKLQIAAILEGLPEQARILCVGAGTGAEMLFLADRFPGWQFTAVEPAEPMLDICRQKAEGAGVTDRIEFHQGYLDSLPSTRAFDAATSILVSQFILDPDSRKSFFRGIKDRLVPGGLLVTADLSADWDRSSEDRLFEIWSRLIATGNISTEKLEGMRAAYGRDVAITPPSSIEKMLLSSGIEAPLQFFQSVWIRGWLGRAPIQS